MFTWRHLLWLLICAVMTAATVAAYRRKRPPLSKVLKTAMIISILSEIIKISSVIEMVPSANGVLYGPYIPLNHLPLHFCSVQIILIFFVSTTEDEKKREKVLGFMYSTGMLGALAALAMPSIFTTSVPVERAFVSPLSYQFFIFHSMLVALGIIIAISGEITWRWKHCRDTLLFVYLLGFISLYVNSLLASPTYVDGELISVDFWTNFFFTFNNPLGIRMTELWQWALYFVILLIAATLLIILSFWPLVRRDREKQEPDEI